MFGLAIWAISAFAHETLGSDERSTSGDGVYEEELIPPRAGN